MFLLPTGTIFRFVNLCVSILFFILCPSFLETVLVSSSCCDYDEQVGSHPGREINCQSNGTNTEITQPCNANVSSYHDKGFATYTTPSYVTGWMYVNQDGQMCGPYIQEQLYEGLATGFLPEELHVYPILNGILINPVPLKYFRQFPDHVATGFTYLAATASGTKGLLDSSVSSTSELVANTQEFSTKSSYPNCGMQSCLNHYGSGSNYKVSSSGSTGTAMTPSIPLVCLCPRYVFL